MKEELQKMYDSEINVRISSFWDAQWRAEIMVDEWKSDWDVVNLDQIIPALQELILKYLPDSKYAKELKLKPKN